MVLAHSLYFGTHILFANSLLLLLFFKPDSYWFQAEEVDVVIDPKDIELTTARSGGAGGISQHMFFHFLYTLYTPAL